LTHICGVGIECRGVSLFSKEIFMFEPLLIGKGETAVHLLPKMANRHGLIAGATGTGKTVTLQVLAEGFSHIGVPVFLTDVKGDLSGISQPGADHPKLSDRLRRMALEEHRFSGFPVTFWDVYREQGHPVRTTITDMGPLLLGRLLNLNETQQGVLSLVFRVADDNGWLLLDLKDLRAMLRFVADHRGEFKNVYGNVSPASVGAIQRRLISLEDQGGNRLFGEPDLQVGDMMQSDEHGHGVINILDADRLMKAPQLYSTLLLWLLSELFEQLPEVGDRDRPELVLFFDEAHLLFDDAPKVLLDKIEQVVRLIRSKGVGVYFVTQSPLDIPLDVLGQLGNRIQHALRAFTPKDQKAVRAAAQTFRENPKLDTATAITELGVGEALVSTLDARGQPERVERVLVVPPRSRIGPVSIQERQSVIVASVLHGVYDEEIDRHSAYEILQARAEQVARQAERELPPPSASTHSGRGRQTMLEALGKSAMRSIGTQIGRQIARGLLGSLFGKRR
jgi:DNA double-strand break repair helicase HerA and related ATPase